MLDKRYLILFFFFWLLRHYLWSITLYAKLNAQTTKPLCTKPGKYNTYLFKNSFSPLPHLTSHPPPLIHILLIFFFPFLLLLFFLLRLPHLLLPLPPPPPPFPLMSSSSSSSSSSPSSSLSFQLLFQLLLLLSFSPSYSPPLLASIVVFNQTFTCSLFILLKLWFVSELII